MASISGGDNLNEALHKIAARLGKGGTVKVGFLAGATYPNGTSVAMVAAIQNFGAPRRNIPPRPFFTNMVKAKSPSWPKAIEQNLRETNYDVQATLERVGAGIKSQLQDSIRTTNAPPLADKTVKRKGFAKPLVDTGHMLNSVDYEVDV